MRERILCEAHKELVERGLKFTMDQLARRLSVSKRTLYENFTSKEEIIGVLLMKGLEEVQVKRETIMNDSSLPLCEKFKQLMIARSSLWMEIPDSVLLDIKKSIPSQWIKVDEYFNETWKITEEILQKGVEQGCLRPVFFPAVQSMFRGAFTEFANYSFLLQHKVTIEEMIKHMTDILMFGLVASEKHTKEAES